MQGGLVIRQRQMERVIGSTETLRAVLLSRRIPDRRDGAWLGVREGSSTADRLLPNCAPLSASHVA